jgi:acyl-CoA thioesterase
MDQKLLDELERRSRSEPYAKLLGFEVVKIEAGNSLVRMNLHSDLENLFGFIHGGALFSLIDEAFQLAANSHGIWSVALNVSITYMAAPQPNTVLEARAEEIHKTNRTATYYCDVREHDGGKLIATAQALAYRTGKKVESSLNSSHV